MDQTGAKTERTSGIGYGSWIANWVAEVVKTFEVEVAGLARVRMCKRQTSN